VRFKKQNKPSKKKKMKNYFFPGRQAAKQIQRDFLNTNSDVL
jgi:hypothetical protein